MNIDQHYIVLKKIAIQHRKLTGNIISGLTGEIGEWQTAKLLNLKLTSDQNTPGYDAKSLTGTMYQIKSSTPDKRNGKWCFSHVCVNHYWDRIVFCFMTINYEVICIYRMTKRHLTMAQTISAKKYKSITGVKIFRYGTLVYKDNILYAKYIATHKESKGLSRHAYIKHLLMNGVHKSTDIIDLLATNRYDISNIRSIKSNISTLKRQL